MGHFCVLLSSDHVVRICYDPCGGCGGAVDQVPFDSRGVVAVVYRDHRDYLNTWSI